MSKSNYQKIAISEIQAQTYAKNHYGLVGKAKKLPGDADFNFYFKAADGREAILKISRPDFDLANLNLQSALFQHL
ncbi:MAG: Ser/Thr protein kinase RdoA (MazF antagonist), partial [Saprospiraceae bacterium]